MTRSSYKGPFVDPRLMKKAQAAKSQGGGGVIKTWARDCDIHPDFVGLTFAVHNGRQHVPVFISENMVAHKLGEFAPTRKQCKHGGKTK